MESQHQWTWNQTNKPQQIRRGATVALSQKNVPAKRPFLFKDAKTAFTSLHLLSVIESIGGRQDISTATGIEHIGSRRRGQCGCGSGLTRWRKLRGQIHGPLPSMRRRKSRGWKGGEVGDNWQIHLSIWTNTFGLNEGGRGVRSMGTCLQWVGGKEVGGKKHTAEISQTKSCLQWRGGEVGG